jgi:hypothetical protein
MSYLSKFGYAAVALPRTTLRPGQILLHQNGALVNPSPLTAIFEPDELAPPKISGDRPAASLNGDTSDKLELNLGLNILGGFITALGGSLGFKFAFNKTKRIEFVYQDVQEAILGFPGDDGEIEENFDQIDKFLHDAILSPGPTVLDEIKQNDLYLTTAVIKSRKMLVKATDSRGADVAIDIPTIQGVVGGNVKVTAASANNSTASFEGDTLLVFGIRPVQLLFKNGAYRTAKSAPNVAVRGLVPTGSPTPREILLSDRSPVIRVG